jgi:hypothetical protein
MDTAGVQVPLRVADADWEQFRAAHRRAAPSEIRNFIAWQLHRPGAAEPRQLAESDVPELPPPPRDVVAQFTAWYWKLPGAEMPRRPGGETRAKTTRVPPGDWQAFVRLHGGKASEAVKMFIAWQLRRPGAELPVRIAREALP